MSSYKANNGQTVLDVLLRNKGNLEGLVEIKEDVSDVTEIYGQGKTFAIKKVRNEVTKKYDRENVIVISEVNK